MLAAAATDVTRASFKIPRPLIQGIDNPQTSELVEVDGDSFPG